MGIAGLSLTQAKNRQFGLLIVEKILLIARALQYLGKFLVPFVHPYALKYSGVIISHVDIAVEKPHQYACKLIILFHGLQAEVAIYQTLLLLVLNAILENRPSQLQVFWPDNTDSSQHFAFSLHC